MRWIAVRNFQRVFIAICFLTVFSPVANVHAQVDEISPSPETIIASPTAQVSPTVKPRKDVTRPEQEVEKREVFQLLKKRDAGKLSITNFMPYAVQFSISAGVPANTVILIMLLPFLATLIVATRYIVGLTSMGILVPTALTITLLDTGIVPGFILLAAILLASITARIVLKKIRIMQMPKMALSMFGVSLFLFAALTFSAVYHWFDVRQLSIFPLLLLILLSDRIVTLFLERNLQETVEITVVTLILSMLGFILLSWEWLRDLLLVYPELVLLLIPINIMIGRYFGLRMTEYFRFSPILKKK
jgi:hypothetical protein